MTSVRRPSAPLDAASRARLVRARRSVENGGVDGGARAEGTRPGPATGTVMRHQACGQLIEPGVGAGPVHELACLQRVAFARRFPNLPARRPQGAAGERRARDTGSGPDPGSPGPGLGPDR